jgi:hypothetical protein
MEDPLLGFADPRQHQVEVQKMIFQSSAADVQAYS